MKEIVYRDFLVLKQKKSKIFIIILLEDPFIVNDGELDQPRRPKGRKHKFNDQ